MKNVIVVTSGAGLVGYNLIQYLLIKTKLNKDAYEKLEKKVFEVKKG